MATRPCPECGAQVSTNATECPECGTKFVKKKSPPLPPGKTPPRAPPPRVVKKVEAPPVVEKTPEEKKKAKAEKSLRIRKKVAQEILSTEASYIKSLDIVCDKFLKPLQEAQMEGKPIISAQDVQNVFSVIGIIRDLNKKFYQDLEPLIKGYTLETRIGKTILDFAPYFRMYTQYVNAHESVATQQYLRKLDSKAPDSSFKTFCYDVAKSSMCLPLPALLITPVQRIPRYRLLVAEYIKHTDPSHVDHQNLCKALEKIKETAMIINEAVRKQQQRQTVLDLESKFSKGKLVTPSRIFKHQGALMKKCRADDRKYEFFLFNDLFVYAKETSKDRYNIHKKIPIDKAFVVEELPDAENKFSFIVKNSVKSFIVYAENQTQYEIWMKLMKEVMETQAKALNKGDSDFVAPVWESDRKKYCQRQRKTDGKPCNTKFNFIKRRHHCRNCGVLCCSECSPYFVYLREDSTKKERVCTMCILELMSLKKNFGLYRPDQLPPPPAQFSAPNIGHKMVNTMTTQKSNDYSTTSGTYVTGSEMSLPTTHEPTLQDRSPPPPPARKSSTTNRDERGESIAPPPPRRESDCKEPERKTGVPKPPALPIRSPPKGKPPRKIGLPPTVPTRKSASKSQTLPIPRRNGGFERKGQVAPPSPALPSRSNRPALENVSGEQDSDASNVHHAVAAATAAGLTIDDENKQPPPMPKKRGASSVKSPRMSSPEERISDAKRNSQIRTLGRPVGKLKKGKVAALMAKFQK
mmetsp:Transcript_19150/g.28631  ORF Transcript_19150/g.28631 Transcript_19150/m.28631 type:complete len:749 (-) Transcript_19150:241-2487(-)|eukprot:CAMPEP_0167752100 /NCGR_PEP_ID=MMETSP0110_2-20121227/6943_1 /TAXON_ID=629695 /ORGANISM="Gymnochlora sp., Strain CCMP2014" /LENGTH=748 /DNA_ID=CAMNT_0007637663 /DNA_START=111 /DNA_END=2357 /DNA_ORIENTATION=+